MAGLAELWQWRVQVFPVAAGWTLFWLLSSVRRWRRIYYVPIYFAAMPFYELNEDLATYFGDDYMVGAGREFPPTEVARLKRRIVYRALVSVAIAAIVIPAIVGFVGAFFLTAEVIGQLVILIGIERFIAVTRAFVGFRRRDIATKGNALALAAVYLAYLFTVAYVIYAAYEWARPYVLDHNLLGMMKALSAVLIGKLIIQGVFIAALTTVFTESITNRELRAKKLAQSDEESY